MKYCSKCKTSLPLDSYGRDKYQPDGLSFNCKSCRNAYSKKHYAENRQKVRNAHRDWYAANKEAHKEKSRLWQQNNRGRLRDKSAKWRASNLDKAREVSRMGSHRRRARMAGGRVEKYTETQVLAAYGSNCHICGGQIDLKAPRRSGEPGWEKSLHIDHFLEISLGGSDTLDNVRPSHGVCNIRKRRTRKS